MIAQSIIEELPVFLRDFTAYHFRVINNASMRNKKIIPIQGLFSFLLKLSFGDTLQNKEKITYKSPDKNSIFLLQKRGK